MEVNYNMKRLALVLLVVLSLSVLAVGCGNNDADTTAGVATRFAAYQFAKTEIQRQLPVPNSAVFPNITSDMVEITELEDNLMEIQGTVAHRDPRSMATVASSFTIVVRYEGNEEWTTESMTVK